METLIIKELAPYLPYNLTTSYKLSKVISLRDGVRDETRTKILKASNVDFVLQFCTLHLRPLSDLTKPITHNGETFVPMEKLCNDFCNRTPCNPEFGTSKILMHADNGGGLKWWFVYHRNKMTFELSDDNRDMSNHTIPQYEMFQKLFEWNFDVFGLIPRNLAIDINTIKIGI